MRRLQATVCYLLGLALLFPAVAAAHATLKQTEPGFAQRLSKSPTLVLLRFDQSVKALPNAITVYTAKGHVVSGQARPGTDNRVVTAPVQNLPRGGYTVRWRVVSADSHVVGGVFTFGVRQKAPPPTQAFGASGPTTREHIVRWLYFLALALVIGALGFRLLIVRGPLPPRAERRFFWIAGVGALAAIEVGVLAFLLRAEDALQLPFVDFLYGDLAPLAGGTRFGTAFIAMTLGFALVTALVYLAWLTDRKELLWAAFLAALGFASGLSLSGHDAVDPGSSWLSELADWAHLAAACLWVGGLIQLAFVVWPLAPDLRRSAFLRFSKFATGLIVVLLSAGIYLSVIRLPRLSDLWSESYGQVLMVKLGLVSLALLWGAVHHFVVRPALERGRQPSALLPRSLIGESAVGIVILLVAAVLVESKPPPRPAPSAPVAQRAPAQQR
ncbi:MAG TPA: copper resistance protein CopC [Gaiellaceae bacterium]|nr:copper resistance protein CopC [Gaiellaceae bacterium]